MNENIYNDCSNNEYSTDHVSDNKETVIDVVLESAQQDTSSLFSDFSFNLLSHSSESYLDNMDDQDNQDNLDNSIAEHRTQTHQTQTQSQLSLPDELISVFNDDEAVETLYGGANVKQEKIFNNMREPLFVETSITSYDDRCSKLVKIDNGHGDKHLGKGDFGAGLLTFLRNESEQKFLRKLRNCEKALRKIETFKKNYFSPPNFTKVTKVSKIVKDRRLRTVTTKTVTTTIVKRKF